jgi:PAS domain S-box-containing protein
MAEASSPIRILIVDDRPENLLSLQAILGRLEYKVVAARSGEEALRLALRDPFDLILLDVQMPGMDGFEVASNLKTVGKTRDIPILFLTAIATEASQVYRAYSIGAVDYLIKPIEPEMVRSKVAVFAKLIDQRKQIERQAAQLREAERNDYERRLAQFRLASDQRYRKLVEGIDHAIAWSADQTTLRLSFVSRQAERILGYSLAELASEEFLVRHIHPEDLPVVREAVRRAMAEDIDQVCDHRLIAANGETYWFHTGISYEPAGVGVTPELHGISVDITDLKRAVEIRKELLAVVSHDLRNPVSVIKLVAESLLGERKPSPERVEKGARTILGTCGQMQLLISDLLDMARIEAGQLSLERKPVEAGILIRTIMEMVRPLADRKGQRLEYLSGDGFEVVCDGERVLQILSNLLGNAIKFTPKGGSIEIAVERRKGEAVFSVTDSGPGIPPERKKTIFQRYWRGSESRTDGAGLGLSIVKGLVELHGGRVWAESVPGAGATFRFTIPLSPAAVAAVDRPAGEAPAAH